jgi:hypothetical protein
LVDAFEHDGDRCLVLSRDGLDRDEGFLEARLDLVEARDRRVVVVGGLLAIKNWVEQASDGEVLMLDHLFVFQGGEGRLLRVLAGLHVVVDFGPQRLVLQRDLCLENTKDGRDALLAVEDVVCRIRGVILGELEGPEVALVCQLLLRAPEQNRAKRIALVNAVHQVGDALRVPDEAALEIRNAHAPGQKFFNDFTDIERLGHESPLFTVSCRMGRRIQALAE